MTPLIFLRNKSIMFLFLCLGLLIICSFIFGKIVVTKWIISIIILLKNNVRILCMIIVIGSILSIIGYVVSLYILNNYIKLYKKGETVVIPEVLPDIIIKRLRELEIYSRNDDLVKELKSVYYLFISICIFLTFLYGTFIFIL